MDEGIIEKIVRKEIDRRYNNVFTEFKTNIVVSKNKIIDIYLGNLKRCENKYSKPEDMHLNEGERDIRIKVESVHEPVIKLWLEKGFEFFEKLGEEDIKLVWHHCLERIKSSPKQEKDITDLIRSFDKGNGKEIGREIIPLYYYYSDYIPLFEISDEIRPVKRFLDIYKKEINLDEAILRNYSDAQEWSLEISRSLFYLKGIGTNSDAKKYAKMVDEFLKS